MCPRGTQPGGLTHTRDWPSQNFATNRNATTPRVRGLTPFSAIPQAAPSRTQRQVSTIQTADANFEFLPCNPLDCVIIMCIFARQKRYLFSHMHHEVYNTLFAGKTGSHNAGVPDTVLFLHELQSGYFFPEAQQVRHENYFASHRLSHKQQTVFHMQLQ